jgi:hypothetical protein
MTIKFVLDLVRVGWTGTNFPGLSLSLSLGWWTVRTPLNPWEEERCSRIRTQLKGEIFQQKSCNLENQVTHNAV